MTNGNGIVDDGVLDEQPWTDRLDASPWHSDMERVRPGAHPPTLPPVLLDELAEGVGAGGLAQSGAADSGAAGGRSLAQVLSQVGIPPWLTDRAALEQPTAPTGTYIVVHGHFYQPPRENPYLETIVRQPSATPCHDWNERVSQECYRPNAFARICNDQGQIVGILNNYEYISFNIGPTLMSWLEVHDPITYERIVEADRRSCQRLHGRGNAIAQVYNHIIMPLANDRDKRTQVRWGIADFRHRFGRDPQSMWLAETAVDYATLEVLVDEGLEFLILAPSQAERCRPLPTAEEPEPDWIEVGGGQIDPTRPYRCYLPQGNTGGDRYIDIFFYDGPISGDIGFSDALQSSEHFALRLGQAVRGDRQQQVIALATDGETFGHHKAGKERCLAYALAGEFPKRGWLPTNFAHYLSLHPPAWEVEIKPVTAWSCMHGVDRWQDDCGCGGGDLWHQQWRRPLRDSLNWLRDRLIDLYEREGRRLLRDPWQARDAYIQVILDRSPASVDRFLNQHQAHPLDEAERSDALRLLEMQRHALLMFTSCGWFFEEISRPEGTQILRYAGRAIALAAEVAGVDLETEFMEQLAAAPSNVNYDNGAAVYQQLVLTDRVSPEQVAAAYAIESLIDSQQSGRSRSHYGYHIDCLDYRLQRLGSLSLAIGQVQLLSNVVRDTTCYTFAALHLGGWDFHCCVQPAQSRLHYHQLRDRLTAELRHASAARLVLALNRELNRELNGSCFGLPDLFAEDRHRIAQLLVQDTLAGLDRLYDRVYRSNYGILLAFRTDELPVPQELQVAAEISLGHRIQTALTGLEREAAHLADPTALPLSHLAELEALATEVERLQCRLDFQAAQPRLEQTIQHLLSRLLRWSDRTLFASGQMADPAPESPPSSLPGQPLPPANAERHAIHPCDPQMDLAGLITLTNTLERILKLGRSLNLVLQISLTEECYFAYLHTRLIPAIVQGTVIDNDQSCTLLIHLLSLGQVLRIWVDPWLKAITNTSISDEASESKQSI